MANTNWRTKNIYVSNLDLIDDRARHIELSNYYSDVVSGAGYQDGYFEDLITTSATPTHLYGRLTDEITGGSSFCELLSASGDFARFGKITSAAGIYNFSSLGISTSANMNCWAYGAGIYVKVGAGGMIQTSPTGAAGTWTTRESGTSTNLNSVTYKGAGANQGFWAVGGSARLYSADGVTWETKSTTGGNVITFSTTSPDRGFIGGGSFFAYITTDGGSTWTTVTHGDSQGTRAAAFVGSDLYYVTRNAVTPNFTRVRQIDWSAPSNIIGRSPNFYPFFDRQMIVLGSGRVVISGDNGGIYYSDTPNTSGPWVSVTISGARSLRLMEANGLLYAFGEDGEMYVSDDDGATWNKAVERFIRGTWLFEPGDISGTSVADRSGYGHTGTLIGSPSFGTAPIGRSVVFDGTAKRVAMGDVLDIGTGSLSISVWVKTTDTGGSGNDNQIVNKRATGSVAMSGYQVGLIDNGIFLRIADGTVGRDLFSGNIGIADGQWHHVVAVWERSGTEQVRPIIYVDGATVPNSSGFVSLGSVTNDVSLQIGAGAGGDFHRFDGEIAAPTIYPNAVISLAEAQAIYAAESQGMRYAPNHPAATGVSTFLRYGMHDPANPTRAIVVGDSGTTLAGNYSFNIKTFRSISDRQSNVSAVNSENILYSNQPATVSLSASDSPSSLSVIFNNLNPQIVTSGIDFDVAKKLLGYTSESDRNTDVSRYCEASWNGLNPPTSANILNSSQEDIGNVTFLNSNYSDFEFDIYPGFMSTVYTSATMTSALGNIFTRFDDLPASVNIDDLIILEIKDTLNVSVLPQYIFVEPIYNFTVNKTHAPSPIHLTLTDITSDKFKNYTRTWTIISNRTSSIYVTDPTMYNYSAKYGRLEDLDGSEFRFSIYDDPARISPLGYTDVEYSSLPTSANIPDQITLNLSNITPEKLINDIDFDIDIEIIETNSPSINKTLSGILGTKYTIILSGDM